MQSPTGIFTYPSKKEENAAPFALLKYHVRDWLLLKLGARYDYFESFKDEISPRLAVIFKVRQNLSLFFSTPTPFRHLPISTAS